MFLSECSQVFWQEHQKLLKEKVPALETTKTQKVSPWGPQVLVIFSFYQGSLETTNKNMTRESVRLNLEAGLAKQLQVSDALATDGVRKTQ